MFDSKLQFVFDSCKLRVCNCLFWYNRNNLEVARVWVDSDGEDDYEILSQIYVDEKHPCRIYWNYEFGLKDEHNKPIKEATISITADGYEEPAIIKVKYPKRPREKTVVFKHK